MNANKTLFGSIFAFFNLVVLLAGIWLIYVCFPGLGEGQISIVAETIGKVSGINGHLAGIFVGAAMAITAVIYGHKSFTENLEHEQAPTFVGFVRHHYPLSKNELRPPFQVQ
jgi:hypothetical protein